MVSTKFAIMSMFSIIIVIIILLLNSVKTDEVKSQNVTSSMQNFKESVTKMIKEQGTKIGDALKKIQTNSQWVLRKIKDMNEKKSLETAMNEKKPIGKSINEKIYEKKAMGKTRKKKYMEEGNQIEAPVKKRSRSFSTHYGNTGYGTSGNAYAPTYHHHSIGLDPINIVVSMSLISFLIQALQGLLVRTRLPTPVVEARSYESILPEKLRVLEKKSNQDYFKARYRKPYFNEGHK